MSFSFKQEENGTLLFLEAEVSGQRGKFVTTVYSKSTLKVVYTHLHSFFVNGIQVWYNIGSSLPMFRNN